MLLVWSSDLKIQRFAFALITEHIVQLLFKQHNEFYYSDTFIDTVVTFRFFRVNRSLFDASQSNCDSCTL